MTRQIDLIFDYGESARRKRFGMSIAASKRHELLSMARKIAMQLARQNGETNCDQVSQELSRQGLPDCLGPAAGSIFKTADWEFTGRFVNSERTTNHSRLLRVWRLK